MPVQPRTPPGVLELLPAQQIAHQRMVDKIRENFELFGYLPVETPAFELTDVLLTKSGGETEKQVYFVQSTGALNEYEKRVLAMVHAVNPERYRPELALRFDLTVPLARYVAEHEHELNFPFRRYQIQRVYRGERAQKGRFREFYQCDIDVIGKESLSLAYDAEIPAVIHSIFSQLAIGNFTIYINNRKLLRGILDSFGVAAENHAAVLHEVDRLGKQDRAEIAQRLLPLVPRAVELLDLLECVDPLGLLRTMKDPSESLVAGLAELQRVYDGTRALGVPEANLKINLAIARGLDYYTGTVYETFLDDHKRLGSICSGGRYDNLAEHYTKSKLPGVGISIGLTRLFSQLLDLKLIDLKERTLARVLVLQVEPALSHEYAGFANQLRHDGIRTEVYGADDKLGKQLKYADRAGVPLALLFGSREQEQNVVKIKDLREGAAIREHDVPRAELVARVKTLLGS